VCPAPAPSLAPAVRVVIALFLGSSEILLPPRTHDGERTVRALLDFARGEGSKGGPPLGNPTEPPA
jgi:hypothetical protein